MNKKIEELAEELLFYTIIPNDELCDEVAEYIINAGYRKQEDVAREIFAEIEEVFFKYADKFSSVGECKLLEPVRQAVLFSINELFVYVDDLKKKYGVTEE